MEPARPPMSERQQLAMLKRLERTSEEDGNDCSSVPVDVTSPPRAPLQPVNLSKPKPHPLRGPSTTPHISPLLKHRHHHHHHLQQTSAALATGASGSSPRTPAEERVMKRLVHVNSRGETYLHKAAIKGSSKLVEKLLRLGADPNARDHAGYTPLHEACNVGQLSVVKLLFKHGALINVYGGLRDKRETPLHDAAINGHLKVVKYLLKQGADLNARRDNGLDVLEYARFNLLYGKEKESTPRLREVVQFLTEIQENGGNLNISDVEDSGSEEDDEKDIASFLGISNSPSVHKFLKSLGIVPDHLESVSSRTPQQRRKRQQRLAKRHPAGAKRKSEPTSKTRLSFEMEEKTEVASSASTTSSAGASSLGSKGSDDVYEFKPASGGSKEPAASTKSSANSPDSSAEKPAKETSAGVGAKEKPAAEKRGAPAAGEDEDDESKKKKLKKDEGKDGKGSRSTRGNSTEKTTAKTQASGKPRLGPVASDRKSPTSQAGSAANSPKKPNPAEQSDSENDDEDSKNSASGLKVPPLKIVLSGSSGGPGGNGGNGSGNNSNGSGTPSTTYSSSTGNTQATEAEPSKKGVSLTTTSYAGYKEEPESIGGGKNDDEGDDNSGNRDSEGSDGGGKAGGSGVPGGRETGPRLTRSRANQGTPGPEGSAGADLPGNTSEASSTNTQDNSSSNERSERSNYTEYHVKKRKLRSQVDGNDQAGSSQGNGGNGRGGNGGGSGGGFGGGSGGGGSGLNAMGGSGSSNGQGGSGGGSGNANEPLNDIQKYLKIRKQVEQRRKNLFPVHPKPPQGYRDYLMNRKTYLLESNANERLRSMPMIQPPPSLEGPLRELFVEQEKARYQLRKRHLVEKEKLVLTVEQEIIRVHGRAARALANQPFPYSVCTILRDEEIYTPIDSQQEEKNRDIRSRYNGRLFLSWLQDVDDKWEKIKEQMVLRHHNEAESLNAVQKMDWEWKLGELSGNSSASSSDSLSLKVDDLYIPMVHVSDDFDLSDNR